MFFIRSKFDIIYHSVGAKSISVMIIIINSMLEVFHKIPTMRLIRFMLALIVFSIIKTMVYNNVEVQPDMTMPREVWEAWVSAGMP